MREEQSSPGEWEMRKPGEEWKRLDREIRRCHEDLGDSFTNQKYRIYTDTNPVVPTDPHPSHRARHRKRGIGIDRPRNVAALDGVDSRLRVFRAKDPQNAAE